MALRHRAPEFQPSLDKPVDMEKVLPRLPKPPVVEFRGGADLTEVVEAVASKKVLNVEAAVGAGKSTRLPYEVAAGVGILVVQVFPNEFLASDISDFCRMKGFPSVYVGSADEDFPDSGVACVSAGVLVAKWLQNGDVALPMCVLFHDESHESDAYTYLVKNIAPTLRTVKSYVTATATSGGSGFRRMEADGHVIDHLIPQQQFAAEWDIYGDAPWSVETLEGHMLIYEDSKSRAEDLAQQYRMAGMVVHRLHSRMPMDEFRLAMQTLRDPSSPLVVLIADYSFRSGFTFPVSRIIDTAKVNNVVVEAGRPVRNTRAVYELEAYQARGRGGRVLGLSTDYYRPDIELSPYICDLEAAEVDAAVLVLRLLGYAVPKHLQKVSSASGDVPRMLISALRGAMPLACLQPQQKQSLDDFFTPSGRRSPYLKEGFEFDRRSADVVDKRMSADVAMSRGVGSVRPIETPIPHVIRAWESDEQKAADLRRADSALGFENSNSQLHAPIPPPLRSYRDESAGSGYDHHDRMEAVADTLRAFTMHRESVDSMEVGTYYYASGLWTDQSNCAAFPDGYQTVAKWMSRDLSESAHMGLSGFDRSVAVNALLLRYNVKTCEMRVLSHAIPEAKVRASGKDLGALRVWATQMSEAILAAVAELRVISKYIIRLVRDFCGLEEMQPMADSERNGRDGVMRELDALPNASIGPSDGFMAGLRSQMRQLPNGYASTVSSDSDGGMGLADVPMPIVGRGMRAVSGSSVLSIKSKRDRDKPEYSIRRESGRRYSLVRRSA